MNEESPLLANVAINAPTNQRQLRELNNRTQKSEEKNIGTLDSFVYVLIQSYGYGVLAIPIVYQQVGLVPTTLFLVYFTLISTICPLLVAEAMALIPGNDKYQRRIEFVNLVEYYFGKKAYYVFQIMLAANLSSSNLASIRVSAQQVDSLLIFIFKKTFVVQFYPSFAFIETNDAVKFYGDTIYLAISLGYVLLVAVFLPLGFMNLKSNIKAQYVSVVLMFLGVVEFIYHYLNKGLHFDAIPIVGNEYTQVIGVFIFTLAYTSLVPSWINEKKEEVSINKVLWAAATVSFVCNLAIGLLGAWCYPNLDSDDLLQYLSMSGPLTRITTYLYTFAVISSSIPVMCITVRNNLYCGRVCGRKTSVFFGNVLPWTLAWLFNAGQTFADLLAWCSLLFTGVTAFIFPLVIYFKAQHVATKDFGTATSFVNLFPQSFIRHWKVFVLIMLISIGLFSAAQIFIDLYYLIILGQNVV
jgi:amino acid permease